MSNRISRICVFCGSSPGKQAEYVESAKELGQEFVRQDIELVYGGGNIGLMGAVAETVMAEGGKVIGIIPQFLAEKEVAYQDITTLHIVNSMHERKAMMAELADGFIALPGGLGTFEELLEILTWNQLGVQKKPCAIFNMAGFYQHLLALLEHAVSEKFLKPVHRDMLLVAESAADTVKLISNYEHTHTDKWLGKDRI